MMEGAGSVASIRRPLNAANSAPRNYTDYPPYQYSARPTPTPPPAASATTSTASSSASRGRCRCCSRCCPTPAASTLGNMGVCGLVLGYTVLGAFAFMALEAGSDPRHNTVQGPARFGGGPGLTHDKEERAMTAARERTVEQLWSITEDLNILYKDNWTRLAEQEVIKFQNALKHTLRADRSSAQGPSGSVPAGAVPRGGNSPSNHRWTFSSSLLYSLTVITTIGYGSVTPHTTWGRLVSILYALVGIPLMLVYLSTMGELLARNFRRLYSRLCGCGGTSGSSSASSSGGKPSPCSDAYRVRHISSSTKHNSIELKLRPTEELKNHPLDFPGPAPEPATPCGDSRQRFLKPGQHPHQHGGGRVVRVPVTLCVLIMAGYVCGGGALFRHLENWSFLEAAFFCFTSLGTIGFGELVPGLQPTWRASQTSTLAAAAYILVGMAVVAMCFNLLQDQVVYLARGAARLFSRRNRRSGRKGGVGAHSEEPSESEEQEEPMAVVS